MCGARRDLFDGTNSPRSAQSPTRPGRDAAAPKHTLEKAMSIGIVKTWIEDRGTGGAFTKVGTVRVAVISNF